MKQNKWSVLLLVILLAGLCSCSRVAMKKANKIMDESNEIIKEAEANMEKGSKIMDQLFSSNATDNQSRLKLKNLAVDATANFDKASRNFSEAGSKVNEALKLDIEEWYREYLSTISRLYSKREVECDFYKEMTTAYNNIDDRGQLAEKYSSMQDRGDAIDKEIAEITDKVKFLEEKYKDKLIK